MYKYLYVLTCSVEQHAVLNKQNLKTSHVINRSCWLIAIVSFRAVSKQHFLLTNMHVEQQV